MDRIFSILHLPHTFISHMYLTHLSHTFTSHIYLTHLPHTFISHIYLTYLPHNLSQTVQNRPSDRAHNTLWRFFKLYIIFIVK